MSIRVVIADDHPLVRDGLRFSIERSGLDIAVVGEAADGAALLELLARCTADVVILDITMPLMNGLDAARTLLRRQPDTRIIMLSFSSTRAFVEEALSIGARGYLTKETAGRNLVEAICEVHAGRFFLSPDITQHVVRRTVPDADRASRTGAGTALSLQERRVLQRIAEGRTAKEIAVELGRAVNTIQAHRKSLMAKLGIHKQADLVRYAVREGIAKL